jgi:hypothetical protein
MIYVAQDYAGRVTTVTSEPVVVDILPLRRSLMTLSKSPGDILFPNLK